MNNCKNCNGYCPSGTLPNGLCSDCDLIGKTVSVSWGNIGVVRAEVTSVSKDGTMYAKRWIHSRKAWSKPRKIVFFSKGLYSIV